ncbi:MAG: nitrite/sulfite reductase [Chthoniobacterales bacterium]
MSETIEINPNFEAIKKGLIPVPAAEQLKLDKDGLDVIHDIYRYAKLGFSAITDGDFDRMKWYGVYRQKPKESGYFMMRTKLPGGWVNGDQAIVLSKIADQYGHGFCDITTRQTVQFHWLKIEDIPAIFEVLDKVHITTSGACGDDTRNVIGCAVSGINPHELLDATPQLLEVNRNMTNNREFSNLPRKYKITISGCDIHCHQPDINCLGFFGLKSTTGKIGYGVKVGGGLSSSPHMSQTLKAWVAPEQVWPVTKALSELFRDEGYRAKRNRARFKFLVADWGVDKILAWVEERLGYKLTPHTDFVYPRDPESDHMGINRQVQDGLYWVGVCFAGGRIRNGELEKVGLLAKKYCAEGKDAVHFTNKQNLIIPNVPEANLEALKKDLDALGLVYEPSNFRKGCVSCTGIEFCNLAVAETKNRMIKLVEELETTSGWYKGKMRVHFSGCPSSCGQHQIGDIGFRGGRTKVNGEMVDAYDMFVGGRLGQNRRFNELLKGKILPDQVPTVIDALLHAYERDKRGDEAFSEYLERAGKETLLKVIEPVVGAKA